MLILPCGTEVAFEMTVLFQFGISVRGQHFTVGVDIHTLAFGLLEKFSQIIQIVTGNHDERSFSTVRLTSVETGLP